MAEEGWHVLNGRGIAGAEKHVRIKVIACYLGERDSIPVFATEFLRCQESLQPTLSWVDTVRVPQFLGA